MTKSKSSKFRFITIFSSLSFIRNNDETHTAEWCVCNQSLFFRFKEQYEKVYMSHMNENLDGSSAAAKNHLIPK